jgi:hypothetical protein
MEAAHAVAILAAKTSAREAAVARDSATLHINDAEDQATLVGREALEQVARAEAENVRMLACACEDIEVLARKVTLLEDELAAELRSRELSEREHQAHFEELTLQ